MQDRLTPRLVAAALITLAAAASPAAAQEPAEPADAILPPELSWEATKVQTLVPPPYDIPPIENGVTIDGILPVATSCAGGPCVQSSAIDLWPQTPYTEVPVIGWAHNGDEWILNGYGHHVSSQIAGGMVCVYRHTQIWRLRVTDTVFDGEALVATRLEGTLEMGDALDPGVSVLVDQCPPYEARALWTVVATADVAAAVTTTPPTTTVADPETLEEDGGIPTGLFIAAGLALLSLLAAALIGTRRRRRPEVNPPPTPPGGSILDEFDEDERTCDWAMYLVDGESTFAEPNILQILRLNAPGTNACCRYFVQIYTRVVEHSQDGYDRTTWYTRKDVARTANDRSRVLDASAPMFPTPLVVHDSRARSQVQASGASLSGMAAVGNQVDVVEDGSRWDTLGEAFDSDESIGAFLLRRAQESADEERESHTWAIDCEREEITVVEVLLKRGCMENDNDHFYEGMGESRISFSSRLSCHQPHSGGCQTAMATTEGGSAQISGDLACVADTPELGSGASAQAGTGWRVRSLEGELGPLSVGSDGTLGIELGAGPAKAKLELQAPVAGDHDQEPAPLVLTGSSGRRSKASKHFDVTMNGELEDHATAEVRSSLTVLAETAIDHHLRVRGSTESTPGAGRPCGCGASECRYCMCSFTMILGSPLESADPGRTNTTRDPAQAVQLPWEPKGEFEATADGLIMVGDTTWALHRPPEGDGTWSATRAGGDDSALASVPVGVGDRD